MDEDGFKIPFTPKELKNHENKIINFQNENENLINNNNEENIKILENNLKNFQLIMKFYLI